MKNCRGNILTRFKLRSGVGVLVAILGISLCGCSQHVANKIPDISNTSEPLRMAISPYQDLALIVNEKQFDLEKKYGIKLEFLTVPGEELISSLASAGQTVDVSYALLNEYLSKSSNLNREGDDPIIFLYPLFVFRGGSFISFNPAVPEINTQTINNPTLVKKFLSYKIGTPKSTWSEMMLYVLAKKAGMKLADVHYTDIPLSDGLLAAQNGSLDMTAAGLTQRNECLKRHGRIVLSMDTLGMGDIIGLACKESVYKKRKKEIESLIKMWLDCSSHVLSDLDRHSDAELSYLKARASTSYTPEEFKSALALEYFPKNIAEVEKEIISNNGKYSINKATNAINQYLIDTGVIKTAQSAPISITLSK
jgi:hypothetical protein